MSEAVSAGTQQTPHKDPFAGLLSKLFFGDVRVNNFLRLTSDEFYQQGSLRIGRAGVCPESAEYTLLQVPAHELKKDIFNAMDKVSFLMPRLGCGSKIDFVDVATWALLILVLFLMAQSGISHWWQWALGVLIVRPVISGAVHGHLVVDNPLVHSAHLERRIRERYEIPATQAIEIRAELA
ncbi:hypothetical protein SAMN05421831_11331 [Allopseudospirillum japonicum]|uniref:Uncharacterized protein n=1 Tax=Allopseudospirillum japonicum TaxID=64971 RepID=A0A1H6UCK1_9GAMM|nr:hypothetical protein [Allopseudospirillum japonicum]SEI85572.1 hypothetical protein SAMN05421831_11331 [Allopseudospirillum japonicum]